MIFETFIIALLMVIAIALLLLEIFMLPGITVAGIGGLLFAAGGLIYAYSVSTCVGHVTFAAAFAWLMRSKSFSRVALNTDIDSRLTSSRELGIVPGDEGVTLSRLAPIGKALIKGQTVEAKALDELIDEGTPVVVMQVEGYNVVVQRKTNHQ